MKHEAYVCCSLGSEEKKEANEHNEVSSEMWLGSKITSHQPDQSEVNLRISKKALDNQNPKHSVTETTPMY